MDFEDWSMWAVGIVVAGIFVLFVYATIAEGEEWDKFRTEHKCHVVGHERGATATGVSSSGKMVVVNEPDKTSWLCDDGIVYTR